MDNDQGFSVVADFMKWLGASDEDAPLFRGHADKRWSLTPSALREECAGIIDQRHLDQWKRRAARFVNPRPTSDIEWLILAQHHGIPTTLLDWTTNPLIALFFASEHQGSVLVGDGPAIDGEVILARRDAFEDGSDGSDERRHRPFIERQGFPGLVNASVMNARSTAQDSVMSIHTRSVPIPIEPNGGFPRFVIAGQDKYSVRIALEMFGLNEERIYVDIARVVTAMRRNLDMEMYFRVGAWRQPLQVGQDGMSESEVPTAF